MSPRRAADRPTLAAVARVAGTSVPTVSKVLRGGTDVSPDMRTRVMAAVQETGYNRKNLSKPEQPQDENAATNVIDLVVTHFEGSWANLVLAGVGREAAASGMDVVLTLAEPGTDWVSRVLRRHSMGTVVALVDPTSQQFNTLTAAGVPVVLIESMSAPPTEAASIGVANWDGGRLAAEHLLTLGHRHLGIIAGSARHIYSRARVDGFRAAVDTSSAEGATITTAYGAWHDDGAARATHDLIGANPDITAIFACSDPMALGVYRAAAERGLSIPDDLSVIGFDDLPEAQWVHPQLTTVRQPTAELGTAAVRLLLDIARAETPGPRTRSRIELATELVPRDSTGQAPAVKRA